MRRAIFAVGLVLLLVGLVTLFKPGLFFSPRHIALSGVAELAAPSLVLIAIGASLTVIAAKYVRELK